MNLIVSKQENRDSRWKCQCGRPSTYRDVVVEIGSGREYYNLCDECMEYQRELESEDWTPTHVPQIQARYLGGDRAARYPVRR